MLVNTAALVSALALLECASASALTRPQVLQQRQVLKDVNVTAGIAGGARIGDQCHPAGVYALGGDKLIPSCISEQGVDTKCRIITGFGENATLNQTPSKRATTLEQRAQAYRECMLGKGSSYAQDVNDCVECKVGHNHLSREQGDFFLGVYKSGLEAFKNAANPEGTVWFYVLIEIERTTCKHDGTGLTIRGWACFIQLPPGTGMATKNLTISDYSKVQPGTQNIASFEFDGKSYPETETVGLMVPTIEITADVGTTTAVKLQNGTLTAEANATANVKVAVQYSEITLFIKFTKPDEFTVLSVIHDPITVKDSNATLPQREAEKLPTVSKLDKELTIEEIQQNVANDVKEPENAVVEALKAGFNDLKNNKTLSVTTELNIISQVKSEINIAAQQNGTRPSDSKGAETSTEDDECQDDSEVSSTPLVGGDDNTALNEITQKASSSAGDQGDPATARVKMTICQMPGEKDCKTYYY